jgi:hypothetical protein
MLKLWYSQRNQRFNMAYIGKSPTQGRFILLDDISGSFDGSTVAFTLQSGAVNVLPENEQNCLISISGVVQYPNDAYTISGSTITFTSAPLATDTFSGVVLGNVYDIGTPSDASVTASSLGSTYYSVNNQTFTDITVTTNKNAIVAGPITVSGTLTIASGSTFVIA